MKSIILLSFLFITQLSFSQEIPLLKLTPNGVDPIVVQIEGITNNQLYEKSINWVKETYENPDNVLKAKIENEKIRINGFVKNAWYAKTLGVIIWYSMDYTVEISFKDGKYKFTYTVGQFYTTDYSKTYFDYSTFFKPNGEVKNMYTDAIPSIEKEMNSLSNKYYNYVSGKIKKTEDNW